jgi:hypothetical protein
MEIDRTNELIRKSMAPKLQLARKFPMRLTMVSLSCVFILWSLPS